MHIEIERKFLVTSNSFKQESFKKHKIKQGFLNSNKHRTVRVRIADDKGFLTVKGKSNTAGISRFEWEKEILLQEAKQLMLLCENSIIEKTRYFIEKGKHTFEVDVFLADNKGLIVAEVELTSVSEIFQKPNWLGKEVTGKVEYYNACLSKNPFKNWI